MASNSPHVRLYLDNDPRPVVDQALPGSLELDTRKLEDGPHRLIIRVEDAHGAEGIEELPFHVQNGPGIVVSGLSPGSTRRGTVHLRVAAFEEDEDGSGPWPKPGQRTRTWALVIGILLAAVAALCGAYAWHAGAGPLGAASHAATATQVR